MMTGDGASTPRETGGAEGTARTEEPDDGRRRGSRRSEKKQRSFFAELPILVILALLLALLIKSFLIQAFYIPSGSMENTLVPGDRVLVNKLAYRLGDVDRGDVIVFNGVDSWESEVDFPPPSNIFDAGLRKLGSLFGFAPIGEKDFIKRVIGIPGDHVVCCTKTGQITVNGKPIREKGYLFPGNVPSGVKFNVTVPEGRLWVMGDHRQASADSRSHLGDPGGGTIPIDHVVGRAFIIVWPFDRLDLLSRPPSYAQAGLALAR